MKKIAHTQAARLFAACFIVIVIWIVAVKTGQRLPYLMTSYSRSIRLGVLFPTLVLLVGWFMFGHRWPETGKTGYAMRMAQLSSKKERVKQTALAIAGLLLLPAMIAWTSIHLVAWAAYFASSTPYEETFKIIEKKSVTGGFSLDMDSRSGEKEVSLHVPISWDVNLRPQMFICAQGRSSVFGTVVESLRSRECSSPLQPQAIQ